MNPIKKAVINSLIILINPVYAGDITELETMQVIGNDTDLTGIASSASQGIVGQKQFAYRPLARVGELIEVIPNALATQHSGSGKANQYFLRGFNLDHGTDFSVSVDGIPMNMPSHAHGQGYLDLNSIIPELIENVDYGKGVYYAEVGDFSSAGYSNMHSFKQLAKGFIKFTGGDYDYYRLVSANSHQLGAGTLLYAGEFNSYNGVWQNPENLDKYNGLLTYNVSRNNVDYSLYAKTYHANWTATNQIPQRAIDNGLLNQYGTMDNSDGGVSSRYSISGNIKSHNANYKNEANIYALYSDLNLYSNFTGYLNDPIQGDQIQQQERRVQLGANAEQTWFSDYFGFEQDNSLGIQIRHDDIMGLALNHTQNRQWLNTIRNDSITQTSIAIYIKNQTQWLKKFRTIAGLRADSFDFTVNSHSLAMNSGTRSASLFSPKLSLILGPWYQTEAFINLGYGYHSNDARGTTLKIDPITDNTANAVNPLVWSRGGEIGFKNQSINGLSSSIAFWYLQMASELVFVGDAGGTEPTGSSERYGVEWNNNYQVNRWLTLDADLGFTKARYLNTPSHSSHISNSVGRVISAGAVIKLPYHFFTTLRLRHFGDVPLNETASFYAGNTTLVNYALGYEYKAIKVQLDLFNLFDSHSNDIAYAYESKLKTELNAVDGVLKHSVEPRMIRLSASVSF
ncbi:MAG: TonB-dependent receptor [Methylococcaceae bacterium]